MLALAQEHFWWSMMAEDCKGLVQGTAPSNAQHLKQPRAPLCPIRAQAPLELVHVDFTSMELTMELNKALSIKNVLVITDHSMYYALAIITKDQMAKTVVRVLYKRFITVFGVPAKLLSDWGGGKLYLSTCGRVVCHVWHSEMPNHRIPPTMQWTS